MFDVEQARDKNNTHKIKTSHIHSQQHVHKQMPIPFGHGHLQPHLSPNMMNFLVELKLNVKMPATDRQFLVSVATLRLCCAKSKLQIGIAPLCTLHCCFHVHVW